MCLLINLRSVCRACSQDSFAEVSTEEDQSPLQATLICPHTGYCFCLRVFLWFVAIWVAEGCLWPEQAANLEKNPFWCSLLAVVVLSSEWHLQ